MDFLRKVGAHVGLWIAEFIIHFVLDEILHYIEIYHGNYCIVDDKLNEFKDKEKNENDK